MMLINSFLIFFTGTYSAQVQISFHLFKLFGAYQSKFSSSKRVSGLRA